MTPVQASVKCAEGTVYIAIFAFGIVFHPSSCTTPAETNHMGNSAGEPIGHSVCTSDTWRHRDSMEPELATSYVS